MSHDYRKAHLGQRAMQKRRERSALQTDLGEAVAKPSERRTDRLGVRVDHALENRSAPFIHHANRRPLSVAHRVVRFS